MSEPRPDILRIYDMWRRCRELHPVDNTSQPEQNMAFLNALAEFERMAIAKVPAIAEAVNANKRATAALLRGLANDLESQP